LGCCKMTFCNHQGNSVKHVTINVCLGLQSDESVLITFDLVTLQYSIHDSHVRTNSSVAKTQLLYKPATIGHLREFQSIPKDLSNFSVSHRRFKQIIRIEYILNSS
jgi:hypothetical protein